MLLLFCFIVFLCYNVFNLQRVLAMITKVVKGCPKELIEKRKNRIQEALDIKFDNPRQPVKFVVDTLPDGNEVYFLKPGKEYSRKEPNLNDMSPNVGDLFTKFSFADIWQLLCKLRNAISFDNYKTFRNFVQGCIFNRFYRQSRQSEIFDVN